LPSHLFTLVNKPPSQSQIMSFEVTATIANFGGKLLKLAHQVNINAEMVTYANVKY
jgi:hypothetical protein